MFAWRCPFMQMWRGRDYLNRHSVYCWFTWVNIQYQISSSHQCQRWLSLMLRVFFVDSDYINKRIKDFIFINREICYFHSFILIISYQSTAFVSVSSYSLLVTIYLLFFDMVWLIVKYVSFYCMWHQINHQKIELKVVGKFLFKGVQRIIQREENKKTSRVCCSRLFYSKIFR